MKISNTMHQAQECAIEKGSYIHGHSQDSSPKEVFQGASAAKSLSLVQPMDEFQDPDQFAGNQSNFNKCRCHHS